MTRFLQDFSKKSLTAANKANLFAYYDYLGRSTAPFVDYRDDAQLKWLLTGVSATFLNNVLRARLPERDLDERLQEVLAVIAAKQVRHLTWWVEPDSMPADLGEHLQALGLAYTDDWPAMAVDLQQLDGDMTAVSGLRVETVSGEAEFKRWADVLVMAFGAPPDESDSFSQLYSGLGFELPLRHYIGYLDGRPVATSQLFLGQGVAGLYCVGTLKEARGQGIGAAMSTIPMLEAREMGYHIGILQASPLGAPVYQRMGFAEHAKLSGYTLTPE